MTARRACWKRGWAVVLASAALQAPGVCVHAGAFQAERETPKAARGASLLPDRALLRIGDEKLRLPGVITGIAFAPDGKSVAAAAFAGVPRVAFFDVQTGRQVKVFVPPDRPGGYVTSVAFSPDGTKLIWGEDVGNVALWDLIHERLLYRERLHEQRVTEVRFSPDGTVTASASDDGTISLRKVGNPAEVVRDFVTGEVRAAHPGLAGPTAGRFPAGPFHLAFTPDGTRLVVGSESSAAISVWRIKDGQQVQQIDKAHGDREGSTAAQLHYVAVTADGRHILSAGASTVPISRTKLKHGGTSVHMSEFRYWDIKTGALVENLHDEDDHGFGVAAQSPDRKHLAVGDFGMLRIIATSNRSLEWSFSLPGCWGYAPAFSPDSSLVAMSTGYAIALFEVQTGRRLHHDNRSPQDILNSAAWSPSGERIVTGNGDGIVRLWEASTGKLIWQKLLAPVVGPGGSNANPAFVAFSGDGRMVVAAGTRDIAIGRRDGIIAIYGAADGHTIRELDQRKIQHAALAPDARMIVGANSQGGQHDTHFVGAEVGTGQTRWSNPGADEKIGFRSVSAMHFQPSSPFFEVALKDGNVIRFNSLTGREQRRFLADWRTAPERERNNPNIPYLWEAAFSADGRVLISSIARWIHVWDVETGELKRRIASPHRPGCQLAVSPDGKTLAASDVFADRGKNAIRVYDVESGERLLVLDPGDDRAGVLCFSPDGSKLFSGFHGGTAFVWDVGRGKNGPVAGK